MVAAPDGVRADVESRDMLEQAASTLIRPAHRMSLNMVISFSMGAACRSGGEGCQRPLQAPCTEYGRESKSDC
jgi:hypothetical protein